MRIGFLCSGGDSPGMNACLRSVVRTAVTSGNEVIGIKHGYEGLLNEEFHTNIDGTIIMGMRSVSGLSKIGGTILHSSRCKRLETPEGIELAAKILKKYGFDALLPMGGNGTLTGALELGKVWDGQIIGLPGTIDNDLQGTDFTIGFFTAVQTAVEAVDKLRDTAGSHDLMFFVEVMGRHCGDIALATAIASGAEIVCIPEVEESAETLVQALIKIKESGKTSVMAIVAEGDEKGGAIAIQQLLKEAGNPFDSRTVVLGHTLRGGSPAPADRILASELGNFAVTSVLRGETGKMAGRIKGELTLTPLETCIAQHRKVDTEKLRLLQIVAG
ncbi:MAG: ATP-dependent 6-phosphofructokinase [Planctomycetaceae bacterium]|nr:ATP-dependent 6-phosphofructokinase [Planctomycetaceae bacterium]